MKEDLLKKRKLTSHGSRRENTQQTMIKHRNEKGKEIPKRRVLIGAREISQGYESNEVSMWVRRPRVSATPATG